MQFASLLKETNLTLKLALPIMTGHVSQMLMGITDTVMIGQLGTIPLAAVAFVNMIIHFILVFGIGLMAAVAVQIAHAHGARNDQECADTLKHGVWIAVLSGLAMSLLILITQPFYPLLGQPPEVVREASGYLDWINASMTAAIVMMCLKNFAEAKSTPWPAFWITLAGVGANVFLNWVLIFGNLGFTAMGVEGAGVATFIARMATALALFAYVMTSPGFRSCLPRNWFTGLQAARTGHLLRLGTPIGLQIFLEAGAFGIATIMLGWIGPVALASHQIALTCAATTFMFPMGLSMAVTIRVGQYAGAGAGDRAKTVWLGSLLLGGVIMGAFAIGYIALGGVIAGGFTSENDVIALTAQLLIIAGIFQVFDGTQVISMGALRGLKDVRVPTGVVFVCYWLIAWPLGYSMAFPLGWGAQGVWIAMATGIGLAAISLSTRFAVMEKALVEKYAWGGTDSKPDHSFNHTGKTQRLRL